MQLDKGKLGGPADLDEEVERSFLSSHLRDINMEVTDRRSLELGALRLVTFDIGQRRDAMALEAAVQ